MLNAFRSWAFWILVLSLLWSLLAQSAQQNLEFLVSPSDDSGSPSNVLLLTAHPDDECMFFAPTILALLDGIFSHRSTLYSLCLSVGDADGLGATRKHELVRSLDVLGVGEGRRWVIDHPDLQDNFTAQWDAQLIANVLMPYVLDHRISTILTFDELGISSHPNHISLPRGAARLLSSFPQTPQTPQTPRPRLLTLVTVPVHEKYTGLLAPLLSRGSMFLSKYWHDTRASSAEGSRSVVVSSRTGYARAHRAMREHWSQLVWFRWLYVSFSRYMWVNEWVELLPESAV